MRLVLATGVLVAAAAAACTSTYGTAAEPTPASSDDGGVDAALPGAPDADLADAGADVAAPPNVLVNGDFQAGCGGWLGTNAKLTPLTTQTGNGLCKICTSMATSFALAQITPQMSVGQGTWTLTVDVSEPPTDAGSVTDFMLATFLAYADGGTQPVADVTTGPALDATWQKVTHVFAVPAATQASVHVAISAMGPGCFLVDEARLVAP